jgi:NAD(P)-dependent dehydrogenase (short-subunit alcohol dehydrogenase family)
MAASTFLQLLQLFIGPIFMLSVQALRPTALVTGSTDGIGITTAKNLAAKGFNVIVHGRDPKRIHDACRTVRSFAQAWSKEGDDVVIESVQADLSTIRGCECLSRDVQTLCEAKGLHLTVLMNNAGVYAEELSKTEDGLEKTFAVNVMAPFVVTSHLLPLLVKEQKSRIVIASSISQCKSIGDWADLIYQRRTYSAHGAYSESKLLDAMLAKEFADRLQAAQINHVTCNSLDPGTVNTKMLLAGWGPIGIYVEDALDQTYLCTSPDLDGVTGVYFRWRTASRSSYPESERRKMWKILSDISPSAADMWKFEWR